MDRRSFLAGAASLATLAGVRNADALTQAEKELLLGGVSAGPAAPNAPALIFVSESTGVMLLDWDFDNTVVAGDTLTRQARVNGATDWLTLVDNTAHVITSGEDTANQITASPLTLGNGTYDIRGFVTSAATGKASASSNVLTQTISDAVVVNYRIVTTGNRRITSAGNYRKVS